MDKKFLIVLVALVLSVTCTIGVTLAWLVAESNVVTNKFTYGTITIEVSESNKQDKDGLDYTNVVPGDELAKDPVVTVVKGSEACYVYVLIDNQLGSAATYDIASTWVKVGESGTKVLYRYTTVVNALNVEQDCPVFTELTFSGDLKVEDVKNLAGKNVVISAYAHQADNTDEATATAAAIAWAKVTAVSTNG